jgi:hypothetical protein
MMDYSDNEDTREEDPDFTNIANEIEKLSEEVKEMRNNVKSQKDKESKARKSSRRSKEILELTPALEYVNELLENSSEHIVSEMKSEFFRLFNFLSSMLSVAPQKKNNLSQETKQIDLEKFDVESDPESEKELMKLLLEERESLIYELSDQLVAMETEKKTLKDKLKSIEEDKIKWDKQKDVFERLVRTDPRFNIITLLRRMGVIAPIQLSFVLGVSLSQTRRYIRELEEMRILVINEDETVSLHPSFDEETMNVKAALTENEKDKVE